MSNKKAFTLIELLIVVLILSILAVLSLPSYRRVIAHAIEAEACNIISLIIRAQELYYAEDGGFILPILYSTSQEDPQWMMLNIDNPNSNPSRKFNYSVKSVTDKFFISAVNRSPGDYGYPYHEVHYDHITRKITRIFEEPEL